MIKEEVMNILYEKYIRPTENKNNRYIGVEIEMPIVNLEHKAVDFDTVHSLTNVFLKEFHFTPTGIDEQGHIYSALNNENGDVFSYDCSYNNMEFSLAEKVNSTQYTDVSGDIMILYRNISDLSIIRLQAWE